MRYNEDMKEYATFNKQTPITKWNLLLVGLVVLVLLATLVVTLLPRSAAATATVYVDGKAVSTLDLGAEFNRVATYNGVLVRVTDVKLQTVYRQQVATLSSKGDKILFPTLGVVVELD